MVDGWILVTFFGRWRGEGGAVCIHVSHVQVLSMVINVCRMVVRGAFQTLESSENFYKGGREYFLRSDSHIEFSMMATN